MKWVREDALSRRLYGGAWLNLGSPVTAEIAGQAGYDWLLIDMEHGCGDYSDLQHQLQALSGSDSAPIVRVPEADARIFKLVLDMGPAGLMIPNVTSADMARHVVDISRVPPRGLRGAAQTTRASGYGFAYEQYLAQVNDGLLIVAQIESREAVDAIDDIAAVDGIDVLFVGPLDLSIDLGTSQDSALFGDAVARVGQAAARHGKAAGVLVRNARQALDYLNKDYTFVALGSDRGQVISGMKQNAAFFDQQRDKT